jgi:hypothetical protein
MEALRRSVGGAAAETKAPKKPTKAPQGGGRPEGNVDADRGQEAGKGSDRQEDGVEAAAQVGLADPQDPGLTFFQMAKGSSE